MGDGRGAQAHHLTAAWLMMGWALDLSGGMSTFGWVISFAAIAALMLLALIAFWWIQPRELVDDKGSGS